MDSSKGYAAVAPPFHSMSTSPSGKPSHRSNSPLGSATPKPDPSENTPDPLDQGGISTTPHPSTLSTRSSVYFVLHNFFFAGALISLIIFIIFFAVTWFAVLKATPSITRWNDRVLSNATGVLILGHGLQMDLGTRILTISWKVVTCGANTTSEDPFWDVHVPAKCKPYDKSLVVYLNDLSNPIFSSVPHTELISKRVGIWDPPMFTVEHRFEQYGKRNYTENRMVPFQRYGFNAFVFAIDPTTNLSTHIEMFGILDTLGDYVIQSHDAADTTEFTYESGNGLVTREVGSRILRGEIERSAIAKAFAICLFLVNWTLTVGAVYITALVAAGMLDTSNMVAGLPFSAPLTIPMVRSLYRDSPPFGTSIDGVGFLLQIGTVGLSSLVLFGILVSRQPPPPPPSKLSV